jgi:8-oxo-dGTP pyrophosphatase MutT (NUDIX family)
MVIESRYMGGKAVIDDHINALKDRKAGILGEDHFVKSAVILPLIKEDGETKVLFEKRSSNLAHQPGEICFPGGQMEMSDPGAERTAIRETCEELGMKPHQIRIVAPLDIMVSPFNWIVHPFVAYLQDYQQIHYNPDEVEKIFYVPLDYFLQTEPEIQPIKLQLTLPENYPYHLIPQGRNYPWREGTYNQYFYSWKNEIIWGLTAYIMASFIKLIKHN